MWDFRKIKICAGLHYMIIIAGADVAVVVARSAADVDVDVPKTVLAVAAASAADEKSSHKSVVLVVAARAAAAAAVLENRASTAAAHKRA
jgi:hypothetical protein